MIKRINREDSVLIAIDMQEKLVPAMSEKEEVTKNCAKLYAGLKTMNIPVIATTQYRKGLGEFVPPVAEALGEFDAIDKNTFSCMKNEEFKNAICSLGKKTVIMTGIEAHICVEQTTLDLLQEGYTVFLVADCASSRNPYHKETSLRRMEQAGAVITNHESVLYELLESSKAPEFKAVSAIVKG